MKKASLLNQCFARRWFLIAAFLLVPGVARANMVWLGLMLTMRYYAVWPILTGLLIEFLALSLITDLSLTRLIGATVSMNVLSAAVGIVLIPASTFVVELMLFKAHAFFVYPFLVVLVAASANVLIEYPALLVFKPSTSRIRLFFWLWGANVASVAAAAISLLLDPIRTHH